VEQERNYNVLRAGKKKTESKKERKKAVSCLSIPMEVLFSQCL